MCALFVKILSTIFSKDRLSVKYYFKGTVLSHQIWDFLIHPEPVNSLRSSGIKPLSVPKLRLKMKHGRSQSPDLLKCPLQEDIIRNVKKFLKRNSELILSNFYIKGHPSSLPGRVHAPWTEAESFPQWPMFDFSAFVPFLHVIRSLSPFFSEACKPEKKIKLCFFFSHFYLA